MPVPVAMSSSEAEYNEACLAHMATGNMHMTLNHIEGVQEGSKDDLPVDILMDKKSAVDMSVYFKDTKNARHIRRRFHFVKQGVDPSWNKLKWIGNQYMGADVMTNILCKKPLEDQTQWFMTKDLAE